MKHGPIALIDEMMPVMVISATEHTNDKMVSNIEEVKARKGRIIGVVTLHEEVKNLAEFVIEIPQTMDELSIVECHSTTITFLLYRCKSRLRCGPA